MNIILVLFLFSVSICTVYGSKLISIYEGNEVDRIVGGHEAKPHSHPYIVSLQKRYIFINRHNCGGSLITNTWVLTAGHCVTESAWSFLFPIDVFAGIHNQKSPEKYKQVRTVVERHIHPDYKGDVNPNDIALLRVNSPFVFNARVQPIRLAERDTTPEGGSNSTLSGWGLLKSSPPRRLPDKLQEIVLPILTFQECNESVESFRDSPDDRNPLDECSNVCTGPLTGGKSACNGDSGGPLTQTEDGKLFQVGIVSWGFNPCGTKGAPSVYTKVSSFIDFIEEHLDLEDNRSYQYNYYEDN